MGRTIALTPSQLDAVTAVAWLLIAVAAGTAAHRIIDWSVARWAARNNTFAVALLRRTRRPAAFILPLLAILIVAPNLDLPPAWTRPAEHLAGICTIAAVGWALIALIRLWADVAVARHRIDVADNLVARQLGTRVDILTRSLITIIVMIALGAELMTFPSIRAVGTTLLASAGVAGLALGIAARPLFENLIAGLQLAFTQPIRLDDVVVIEKQFGRIEELHSTYVVVRLWDLRRLIVPLSYFINTPFENWTYKTAHLMGEVYFFADYTLDVEALRRRIPEIVRQSPLWDGSFTNLQVTDATERTIQVRVLVTARNSSDLFDLRCFVRESVIAEIARTQPAALPFVRSGDVEVVDAPRNGHPSRIAAAGSDGASMPGIG